MARWPLAAARRRYRASLPGVGHLGAVQRPGAGTVVLGLAGRLLLGVASAPGPSAPEAVPVAAWAASPLIVAWMPAQPVSPSPVRGRVCPVVTLSVPPTVVACIVDVHCVTPASPIQRRRGENERISWKAEKMKKIGDDGEDGGDEDDGDEPHDGEEDGLSAT